MWEDTHSKGAPVDQVHSLFSTEAHRSHPGPSQPLASSVLAGVKADQCDLNELEATRALSSRLLGSSPPHCLLYLISPYLLLSLFNIIWFPEVPPSSSSRDRDPPLHSRAFLTDTCLSTLRSLLHMTHYSCRECTWEKVLVGSTVWLCWCCDIHLHLVSLQQDSSSRGLIWWTFLDLPLIQDVRQ